MGFLSGVAFVRRGFCPRGAFVREAFVCGFFRWELWSYVWRASIKSSTCERVMVYWRQAFVKHRYHDLRVWTAKLFRPWDGHFCFVSIYNDVKYPRRSADVRTFMRRVADKMPAWDISICHCLDLGGIRPWMSVKSQAIRTLSITLISDLWHRLTTDSTAFNKI